MIETKLAAHFFVNLQFAKVVSGRWPLHVPTGGRDKIAFVRAVPKMGAELDRYDPAKSGKKAGIRNDEGNPIFDV